MNDGNLFCKNLYSSIVELFDNSPEYTVYKSDFITTVTILPHGFFEVLNDLRHEEYLYSAKLQFKDYGQRIEICLKKKEDGTEYVVLKFSQTNYIKIDIDSEDKEIKRWYTVHENLKRTFLIYSRDNIYIANPKNNGFYPATLSDFKYVPAEICEYFFSHFFSSSMIWKDFLSERFFPPIKLNELSDYHNKKEFFEKQFCIKLPKSVNKQSFLKTYAACCAKDYIKPEQISFLFSDKNDIEFSFLPSKRKKKGIAVQYLKDYICRKNRTANKDTVSDYVEFSFALKEPIDIQAGKKKILKYHDILTDKMVAKANHGKKLVIPETPLKYLKMPKEFILLNTKKSLAFEGKRNRNCVGGYVDNINKGRCIIYSADINGEHLTIDIRCRKSRKKNKKYEFYICQCYKSCNQPCKNESLQYVKECVERSSENAVEKYLKANKAS